MWPHVDELFAKASLSSNTSGGEPEFSPEQLMLIDNLLGDRSEEERRQDRELGMVMGML